MLRYFRMFRNPASARNTTVFCATVINGVVLVTTLLSFSISQATDSSRQVESKYKNFAAKDLPIGQLLIVGFRGTEMQNGLGDVIRETKPGGILFFGRNVRTAQQVAELTTAAQKLSLQNSKRPLLIAVDQEGGNVIRIRHTPHLPSALAISKTADSQIAYRSGVATGKLLHALGINVNLAPVVDVSDPDTDRFIGTRSFGDDPAHVAEMTVALSRGLQEQGVLPIAKHFPGHGDASGDSHFIAATSPSTREELLARDLVPYMQLGDRLKKPWGAMLAHVSFPKIDPSRLPATFSKPIITGLLRKELASDILVMTDDIEMAGAGVETDVGLRAVRAIEAGADMVMIAWSRNVQRQVLAAIRTAVESGRLSRARIEEALTRIENAQNAYATRAPKIATQDALRQSLRNPEFAFIGDAVLKAAVRNFQKRRPASEVDRDPEPDSNRKTAQEPNGEPLPQALIESSRRVRKIQAGPDPILILSARRDFIASFRERAKGHKTSAVILRPARKEAIERVLRSNPESTIFAYVSGRQVADFISAIDDDLAARMILVNIETKAAIRKPERFRDIFDIHYRHPKLGAAVAESYLELASSMNVVEDHKGQSVSLHGND
ncbi:MAG: glycoside hydrolase family 3 protein [Bdellovibrionales bacterium]|jgi:beta-N-acetylhexosaminidase|nr:glycoside hydrolase family 3 protein [Bdellovibrionales bacterium]